MRLLHPLAAALAACVALLLAAAPACAEPLTRDVTLDGRLTLIDLHRPATVPAPRAAVIFAHGFMRSRVTFSDHAAAVAALGVLAAVPDLPYVTDSRLNARALTDLIHQLRSGTLGVPPVEQVVLVGFSAGGLSALLAASTPGVVGYVGLDAFDRPGGVGLDAARQLAVPVRIVRARSSFCNAYGISTPWLQAIKRLEGDRVIEGASHCDFEAPTDRICQLFCGRADPARQAIVREALLQAVRDWLPATLLSSAATSR